MPYPFPVENIVVKTYVNNVEVTGPISQLTTTTSFSAEVEVSAYQTPSAIFLETSDINDTNSFTCPNDILYSTEVQSLGYPNYKGQWPINVDTSLFLGKSTYYRFAIYFNQNSVVYTEPVYISDLNSILIATQPTLPQTPLTTGSNVTFTVAASSLAGTLSYQWQKDSVDISGENQSTLSINNIQASNTGYYRVRITSQYNTVYSNLVHITLDNSTAPVITGNIVPINNFNFASIDYGTAVPSRTVVLASTTNISYKWYVNDSEQQNSNSSSFTLQPTGPGNYAIYVVATNIVSNLSVTSFTANCTITPRQFILQGIRGPYEMKSGENGTLTADAIGNGTLTYQWKKNGVNVGTNSTSSSYTITNAQLSDEGTYTVVVTDSYDNATRNSATDSTSVGSTAGHSSSKLIKVHTPIVVTKQPIGLYAANGASISLSCETTGSHTLYVWFVKRTDGTNRSVQRTLYDSSPILTGTLNTSLSADTWDGTGNDLPAGSYFCRIDNFNGVVDTNTVTVGVSTDGGVSEFNNGTLPEVPTAIVLNGVQQIAAVKPVTANQATVAIDSTSTTRPQSVTFTNLKNDVAKVAIAVPEVVVTNSVATVRLEINMLNSAGNKLSDFSTDPVTLTLSMPSSFVGNTMTVYTKDSQNNTIDTNIFTKVSNSTTNEYTGQLTHFSPQEFVDNPVQSVPCFTAGTRIQTSNGLISVEKLSSRDRIVTADGRVVPFKLYTTIIRKATQNTAPYTIPANTFGHNSPAADITLSPLHAIQSRKGVWQIPKYAANQYSGITQSQIGESVTYYHVELPNFFTDNIVAEGTVVESYGAKQTKGLQNVYKYSDTLKGFTRASPPSQSKHTYH